MNSAPLGFWYNLFTVFHLLGDPIHLNYSLLAKLEVRQLNLLIAKREFSGASEKDHENIATVLTAVEELAMPGTFDPSALLKQIHKAYKNKDMDALMELFKGAAHQLCNAKVRESGRPYMGIFTYLISLAAGFIAAVDKGSGVNPPGNRISNALIFSWLVTSVLLSSATGRVNTRRANEQILRDLSSTIKGLEFSNSLSMSNQVIEPSMSNQVIEAVPYHAQPWSGSINSFGPHFHIDKKSQRCRLLRRFILLIPAFISVFIPVLSASVISWTVPTTGLKCRLIALWCIGSLWLISAIVTFVTYGRFSNKNHLRIIAVKDFIITWVVLVLILMSSSGIFNSCWCISSIFSRGSANAIVGLDTAAIRRHKSATIWVEMVFGTVGANLLLCAVVRWWYYRSRHVFGRSESELRDEHLARTSPEHGRSGPRARATM